MAATSSGRMPLLDHLREFRKRLFRAVLFITAAAVIGWFFYNPIITHLAKPVCDLSAAQANGDPSCGALYINGVLGP